MSINKTKSSTAADKPTPFPVDLLPEVMADFVNEAAISIGCDPSYVALPLLASLGRAIGNKRVIRLKAGWDEPPIIWAAVISDSGEFKSPSQRVATQFLLDLQNQHDGDTSYVSQDATHMGVCSELLGQKDTSLLLMPDELSGFLSSLGRGGQSAMKKGEWLSWWQAGSLNLLRYKRKMHIPRVSVSIVGGIQPTPFKLAVLREQNLADGMCARFLLTWQPSRKPKAWSSDDKISSATKAKLRTVFTRLIGEMKTKKHDGGSIRPDAIPMSDGSESYWKKFYDAHVTETHKLDHDLKAAFGKLTVYAARLALIFQCVMWAADPGQDLDADGLEVMGSTMAKAIKLTDWFKGEARRIYHLFSETDSDSKLRDLSATIQRNKGRITARILMRRSSKYKSAAEAEIALGELVRAGLATWELVPTTKKGGRETRECVLIET